MNLFSDAQKSVIVSPATKRPKYSECNERKSQSPNGMSIAKLLQKNLVNNESEATALKYRSFCEGTNSINGMEQQFRSNIFQQHLLRSLFGHQVPANSNPIPGISALQPTQKNFSSMLNILMDQQQMMDGAFKEALASALVNSSTPEPSNSSFSPILERSIGINSIFARDKH